LVYSKGNHSWEHVRGLLRTGEEISSAEAERKRRGDISYVGIPLMKDDYESYNSKKR